MQRIVAITTESVLNLSVLIYNVTLACREAEINRFRLRIRCHHLTSVGVVLMLKWLVGQGFASSGGSAGNRYHRGRFHFRAPALGMFFEVLEQ
jgi:hypothetical protein